VNSRDRRGNTVMINLLIDSVRHEWFLHRVLYDCVEILLQNNADVNFAGSLGRTALHRAVLRGTFGIPIVRYLVNNGANKQARDSDGLTPHGLASRRAFTSSRRGSFMLHLLS